MFSWRARNVREKQYPVVWGENTMNASIKCLIEIGAITGVYHIAVPYIRRESR